MSRRKSLPFDKLPCEDKKRERGIPRSRNCIRYYLVKAMELDFTVITVLGRYSPSQSAYNDSIRTLVGISINALLTLPIQAILQTVIVCPVSGLRVDLSSNVNRLTG